jgi:G3E family GTPase
LHLLLITGFLGSGKTTLVIKLARAVAAAGRRSAILVNEIGQIGIDDALMRRLDLNVWEMVSGCICCTLSADLVSTLEMLDREYDVDLVILEPSGAAEPDGILDALRFYDGRPLEDVRSISVLDPLRMPELFQVMTPLITKQMAHAELLLINKVDVATAEEIAATEQIAAEVNPDAPVVAASAREPLSPALLERILPWQI